MHARPEPSSRAVALFTAFAAAVLGSGPAAAQAVAGQNINMVSGTQWPGGDPFLQRQNEPSLAVSSRNVLHLVAGANDYRTVDLPTEPGSVPGTLSGDAWLGVFKSYDGGLSWQSTLVPGYPQDQSAAGMVSPLKAYSAAADPTVRAGANGLVYYSGMAFNRGTNIGAIFLSRHFDQNTKENGDATHSRDTIVYLDAKLIDTGTSGQFLDKPWIAVDVPRSGSGATTCTITPPGGTAQSFTGGNVYMTWSRFTGSSSTKIMFTRSLDCGKTWSNPIKISESNSVNQGTNIAVDPTNGTVYVAWRRFATSSQPDAIMVAKSNDFGQTFTSKNTLQVSTITPFDQGTSGTRFRTNALPSIAVSANADSTARWVHIAWAQRTTVNQDAQIVVATSPDGLSWTSGYVPVDAAALSGDNGKTYTLARGHQFMPQLTFSQGRLMVLYYDQRLDHTLGRFAPNQPFAADATGNFYQVFRDARIEPSTAPPVFGLTIDDLGLVTRRHTIDLRVAEAIPGVSPSFKSASVSQYRIGLRSDLRDEEGNLIPVIDSLNQLQSNPPNLPLFAQGTVPFLGDYIDIAGPTIVANGAGGWKFNTAPTSAPIFYATWTDNRDVVPPADGDWTHYTPVGGGGTSVLDPSKTSPACLPGQAGMRNQNIYSSRITEGLLVGSPQNAKPLFALPRARAFIVTLQNLTSLDRTFTLALSSNGATASFLQGQAYAPLTVTVAAHSGAARPVFASSSNPAASVTVTVTESGACSGTCLSGSIVLNPEGSVSPLAQPDGSTTDIGSIEIYTPTLSLWNAANSNPFLNIASPNISNPNISNPNISNADPAIVNLANPNISNPNISNPNISNPNISNPNISNPDPANPNISNPNISNTTAANPNISNPNISNPNISNAPLTDTTYAVTNAGNTAHSYRVALYGNNSSGQPLQLIVTKNYFSQTSGVGCTLQLVPQSTVLANVNNAVPANSLADATNPNIPDGSTTNATMALAPGETALVTLRGALTPAQMADLVRGLTPVVTAHGKTGAANDFAMLLFIQTTSGVLPAAVVGVPYNGTGYQFQAAHGSGTITWSWTGTLPSGLSFSPSGLLSGTPSGAGTFTFNVTASDGSPTPQTSTQTINMTVAARATSTSIGFGANPAVVGQAVPVTVTVADTQSGGTPSAPAGTVTLGGDPGLSATSCTLVPATSSTSTCGVTVTPATPGSRTISASFPATTIHQASGGGSGLTVNQAGTTNSLSATSNPSVFGQPVTLSANLSVVAPGSGTPTGTVTFFDAANSLGTAAISGGVASITTSALAAGTRSLKATYGGDANFAGSTSATFSQTVNKASTTSVVSANVNPSVFGQPVTLSANVSAVAPGAGSPTGTVTFYDNGVSVGTATALVSGAASLTTSALSVGSHSITSTYSGDGSFVTSTSAPLTENVNKASSSTAVSTSPAAPVFGQTVTLTASVTAVSPGVGTPGGTVSFLDNGAAIGSPVTLSGGTATLTTASLASGSHAIAASYSGDGNFAGGATAAPATTTVGPATTTTNVTSSAASTVFGQAVTFTATVNVTAPGTGTPTGTVTFSSGATVLGTGTLSGGTATLSTAGLPVGSQPITATYAGTASYGGSASPAITQTVGKAGSASAVSSSAPSTAYGQAVTFTATVTAVAPGAGTPTGGQVTFSDGGATIGTATLTSGMATLTTSSLTPGAHAISVTYLGDAGFNASSSSNPFTQTVGRANQATTLAATPANPVFGQQVALAASVGTTAGLPAPSGTIMFKDGAAVLGTVTLPASGLSTWTLTVGSHSVTAVYSGDGNYASTTSAAVNVTVGRAGASTSVTSNLNPSTFGQSVTFTATISVTAPGAGSVTGAVTFFDGSTSLGTGTVSGGVAIFTTAALAVGTHPVTAAYGGDGNFIGSLSGTVSQVVIAPPFTFTGFQTPLATAGTLSTPTNSGSANYGNGVPVKYQLLDYLGNNVTDLSTTALIQAIGNSSCSSGHAPDGATTLLYSPTTGAKGGSTFRSGSSGFIFNWDTGVTPGPGCYTLVVQLSDGSAARATNIQLR